MKSQFNNLRRILGVLGLLFLIASCQDTIPARSLTGSISDTPECTETQTLTSTTTNGVTTYSCEENVPTRPSGAITWKTDFCACKDTKAVSLGNCATYCSTKNTNGTEILYASFTTTEAVSLNTKFQNVAGWCTAPLTSDTENPVCKIEAKDEQGNIEYLNVTPSLNTITSDVSKLTADKTYVLTLIENSSKARSNSVQIVKFSDDLSIPSLGPLKNVAVSQYSCVVRELAISGPDIYSSQAYRVHFYFIPSLLPTPLGVRNAPIVCHDIFAYGSLDDAQAQYPRLETLPGVFNLWDKMDPRFYDNDQNGATDVNEIIIQKTRNFGGTIAAGTTFFTEFKMSPGPVVTTTTGSGTSTTSNTPVSYGHFMNPWIDTSNYKAYCPNTAHYAGTVPLFRALGEVINVSTEGLYVAEKAAETITDINGVERLGDVDRIFIRETDLKQVWFYLKNNVPTAPDDTTVVNNTIFFYYPLNKTSPFVRSSSQRVYRLKSAAEINNGTATDGSSTSGGTKYPPHDKRIGCIPKF